MMKKNKVEEMKCQLCHDYKGVLVYAFHKINQNYQWYHIVCVNYTPSIWFVTKEAKNAIGVIETVKDTTVIDGKIPKSHF